MSRQTRNNSLAFRNVLVNERYILFNSAMIAILALHVSYINIIVIFTSFYCRLSNKLFTTNMLLFVIVIIVIALLLLAVFVLAFTVLSSTQF
jgi:hypothetical protein